MFLADPDEENVIAVRRTEDVFDIITDEQLAAGTIKHHLLAKVQYYQRVDNVQYNHFAAKCMGPGPWIPWAL